MTAHVFLVPGFFGFDTFGDLAYWEHVHDALPRLLRDAELSDAEVHLVPTLPTASITRRAARLAEEVAAKAGDPNNSIHLIGHSTGALDARLMVTPAVRLSTAVDVGALAARTRSVVGVAAPHRGTPLASLFTSLLGQRLLQVLSLATIHLIRFGYIPLSVVLKLAGVVSFASSQLRLSKTLLDQLFAQLLGDFNPERRAQLKDFFGQVGGDQALLLQLSPESMDLFNATCADRPTVRYGAVITRAEPPTLRSSWKTGLAPYAQAVHSLYHGLYRIAGALPDASLDPLRPDQLAAFEATFQGPPSRGDNDGIVPTRSQVWGEIICAVRADHLDVIGHFLDDHHARAHIPQAGEDSPGTHYDWLVTQSGFKRADFESVWARVARFVAEAEAGAG